MLPFRNSTFTFIIVISSASSPISSVLDLSVFCISPYCSPITFTLPLNSSDKEVMCRLISSLYGLRITSTSFEILATFFITLLYTRLFVLPLLDSHQKRATEENRRVGAGDDADNESEREIPRYFPADKIQDDKS